MTSDEELFWGGVPTNTDRDGMVWVPKFNLEKTKARAEAAEKRLAEFKAQYQETAGHLVDANEEFDQLKAKLAEAREALTIIDRIPKGTPVHTSPLEMPCPKCWPDLVWLSDQLNEERKAHHIERDAAREALRACAEFFDSDTHRLCCQPMVDVQEKVRRALEGGG